MEINRTTTLVSLLSSIFIMCLLWCCSHHRFTITGVKSNYGETYLVLNSGWIGTVHGRTIHKPFNNIEFVFESIDENFFSSPIYPSDEFPAPSLKATLLGKIGKTSFLNVAKMNRIPIWLLLLLICLLYFVVVVKDSVQND